MKGITLAGHESRNDPSYTRQSIICVMPVSRPRPPSASLQPAFYSKGAQKAVMESGATLVGTATGSFEA
jgi:hypothetical protein